MGKSSCRAKNKAECKFHGSRSLFHTRVLRDTYKVANGVYLAAKETQDKDTLWQAYNSLREAEKQYFATEEGSQHLSELIRSAKDAQHRTIYVELQKRSEAYRIAEEEAMMVSLSLNLPVSHRMPKPRTIMNNAATGETMHIISEGDTQDGKTFGISWNERTGTVLYGEKNDVEHMTFLGRADSLEKAQMKASEWFERVRV